MTKPNLFDQVPKGRRWTKPLAELLPELRQRAWVVKKGATGARRTLDEDFAWVVLRGGVLVGYRIRDDLDMRAELRFARQEPLTDEARPKWRKEVSTFFEHFGIEELSGAQPCQETGQSRCYVRTENERDSGKTVARFLQLRMGEIQVGRGLCAHCGMEVPWEAEFGLGQACSKCTPKIRPPDTLRQQAAQ
jgi:hypothetical protein